MTTGEDESRYGAAERRIEWLTIALGFAGSVGALARWGWRTAAGVALGAGLTWLNFRWLEQGVAALVKLSPAQEGATSFRVPRSVYVKFLGRFALLLGVAYVILSRSLLPAVAVLCGLFAVVAATLIVMVQELVRGGE